MQIRGAFDGKEPKNHNKKGKNTSQGIYWFRAIKVDALNLGRKNRSTNRSPTIKQFSCNSSKHSAFTKTAF